MSLPISLRLFPTENAPIHDAPPSGFKINLPINLGAQTPITSLAKQRGEVLRALAAASALSQPSYALEMYKSAKETPNKVIKPDYGPHEGKLQAAINRVAELIDDRSGAPGADPEHIAVARAVGGDPNLVAAAHEIFKEDEEAAKAGVKWVAAASAADLLERAAQIGGRIMALDKVPSQSIRTTNLTKMLKEANDKITALQDEFNTNAKEANDAIEKLIKRVETLEKRKQQQP